MFELLDLLADAIADIQGEIDGVKGANPLLNAKRFIRKSQDIKGKANFLHHLNRYNIKYRLRKRAGLNSIVKKYLEYRQKLNKLNLRNQLDRQLGNLVRKRLFSIDNAKLKELNRQKRNLKAKYNRLLQKIEKENNNPIDNSKLNDLVKEINKTQNDIKKVKDKRNRDRNVVNLRISGNKRLLQSSFLEWGIFIPTRDVEFSESVKIAPKYIRYGNITLSIKGRQYFYPGFPQEVWINMIEAKGREGSGAGTVLWDTFWYKKRSNKKGGTRELPKGYSVRHKKEFLAKATKKERLMVKRFDALQARRAHLRRWDIYYQKRIASSKPGSVIIKVRKKYRTKKRNR